MEDVTNFDEALQVCCMCGTREVHNHANDCPWHEPKILLKPIPGAIHVTVDGKCTAKPMTYRQLVDLAEDCLRAAREMG